VLQQVRGLVVGCGDWALIICHWFVIASGRPSAAAAVMPVER
jgi:hypothetical protein